MKTYAEGKGMNIAHDPDLPDYPDRYYMRYPLREWGFDRAKCGQIIVDAGLELPPKSACFFCPAMREEEIEALREEDPVQFVLAIAMEDIYRTGKHFRGDNSFNVKGVHTQTGEIAELTLFGNDKAQVRDQFRQIHDDIHKPFKYKISVSQAVPGLGRDFAWKDRVPLPLI